ncbi:MAG: methyltransferase domain-containing protein [Spirochaetia bacterium]|nr:methyltransferase domain-containing protein [Spirochaetia bacterium]
MKSDFANKSSIEEIRERFDNDVDRFSNLETGQSSTVDAPLAMELITQAAVSCTPNIKNVLDIGCGAGNNIIKLLQYASVFDVDLIDLSLPMLEKAKERITKVNSGKIKIYQGDFRAIELEKQKYSVIIAAAVLHHLRDDKDWETAFHKIYELTAPGGSVWITDLVAHETIGVQELMQQKYGEYLKTMGGEEYKQKVFNYIEKEDSPRPVTYQLELLRKAGFKHIELLHKNICFAAYGAVKK